MINALARLRHRAKQLSAKLSAGTATEVLAARELLRQSLVELYEFGYWREQPDQFKYYMQLYRACRPVEFNAPPSMSAPDRTARYSP